MKDCIIVTSIVEMGNAPVEWGTTRSVYSHKQRLEQTLETIESIRTYMPDTDILLVECSPESDYMVELKNNVDIFVNTYPNDSIRNCYNKSIGEATLLIKAFDIIETKQYRNIFKMTGRYKLTEKFNKNNWSDDQVNASLTYHYSYHHDPQLHIHTFFYKIPITEISFFKDILQKFVSENSPMIIEKLTYTSFQNKIKNIPEIGIEARWSCFTSSDFF